MKTKMTIDAITLFPDDEIPSAGVKSALGGGVRGADIPIRGQNAVLCLVETCIQRLETARMAGLQYGNIR